MTGGRVHTSIVREVYEELILALGRVLSVRRRWLPDDFIAEICSCIRGSYRRSRVRYADRAEGAKEGTFHPHPALLELLKQLREEA